MATISQRNFSSGELTPALHSRVDLTKYHSGLKTCRNMTVLRHGGVANRPGTRFIGKTKEDGKDVKLIEFIFSREETYVLEFGDQYVRFIKDGEYILSTEATQPMVFASVISTGNGIGTAPSNYISGQSKIPAFSEGPDTGREWVYTFGSRAGGYEGIMYSDSASVQTLRFFDGTFYYALYAWKILRAGSYVVNVSSSGAGAGSFASLNFNLVRYRAGASEVLLTFPRSQEGELITIEAEENDVIAFDSLNFSSSFGLSLDVEIIESVPDEFPPLEIATPYTEAMLPRLNYAQSADVLILCHPLVHPKELQRRDDGWRIVDSRVNPSIEGPINIYGTALDDITPDQPLDDNRKVTVRAIPENSGGYLVTAISEETLEESLLGTEAPETEAFRTRNNSGRDRYVAGDGTYNVDLDRVGHITVQWDSVDGAREYNVYKLEGGVYNLLGITSNNTFRDFGQPTDATVNPPEDRSIFRDGEYPSTVTFHQQRLYYGNTNRRQGRILASKIGKYRDFTSRRNIQADDALDFEIFGREVSKVNAQIGVEELVVLTESAEYTIRGGDGGITPTTINARPETYFGASELIRPIIVGRSTIFAQRGDSILRDFRYDFSSGGYEGNDLTIFSSHLFDSHRLIDVGFVKTPNSNIWVARADDIFLCLTYINEQQIVAWTRCDFENGKIVSMAGVPEDNIDRLYVAVKRGNQVHIERFADREKAEVFLDSSRAFDGRQLGDETIFAIHNPLTRKAFSIRASETPPDALTTADMETEVTFPDGEVIVFGRVNFELSFTTFQVPFYSFTYDKFLGETAETALDIICLLYTSDAADE